MTDKKNHHSSEPIWPTATPLPNGIEATQYVKETLLSSAEIQERFGFPVAPLTIEGPTSAVKKHEELRHAFVEFSAQINMLLGKNRYAALAQTSLEEASTWSHKAIAENDPIDPEA